MKVMTQEHRKQFERDGYCIVQHLLDKDQVATVKAIYVDIEQISNSHDGKNNKIDDATVDTTAWDYDQSYGKPILRKVPAPFDWNTSYRSIFAGQVVLDCIEQLIGPEIYLHSSKLLYKAAGIGRRKPLHQDLAYWEDLTARQVTLWCAIDRAQMDNGCLQVLPGSHKKGLCQHVEREDWQLPEEDFTKEEVINAVMNPGDALFLHPLLVHGSGKNHSMSGRLASIINYYSEPKNSHQLSKYGSLTALRTKKNVS